MRAAHVDASVGLERGEAVENKCAPLLLIDGTSALRVRRYSKPPAYELLGGTVRASQIHARDWSFHSRTIPSEYL